jgi:ABC-type uncharacterized transport system substrate-binding protein
MADLRECFMWRHEAALASRKLTRGSPGGQPTYRKSLCLGLQLQRMGVTGPDEIDTAFAAIVAQRTDALFIADDVIFYEPNLQRQLLDFAAAHRLPTLCGVRAFAEAGCLMAYGYSWRELMRRAAVYVDKILKGAKPGELPIERPMTFELFVNLKTAQALDLTIPPTMLFQAEEVIR